MKKLFLLVFIMTVFLSSCGKTQNVNSELEGTTITEQDSIQETENTDNKEDLESETEIEIEILDTTELINNTNIMQVLIADNYLDEWSQSETGMWDESVTKLCSTSWQSIVLSEESREKYPKLSEKLNELNKENQIIFENFIEQQIPLAQEHYTDVPEYFYEYSSNNKYSVQRADNLILSVREDYNEYTGGVHGMYGICGINYDPSTGEELTLTDVCTKIDELPAILSKKVIEN